MVYLFCASSPGLNKTYEVTTERQLSSLFVIGWSHLNEVLAEQKVFHQQSNSYPAYLLLAGVI